MNKFLAALIVLALAVGGFYLYTQSGEVLNEEAPVGISTTSSAEKPLLEKDTMDQMIPDEPAQEPALPPETQSKIEEMVKEAQMTPLSPEEKVKMEEEAVTMMNSEADLQASSPMEMMSQEEMDQQFISRQGVFTEIDLLHKGSGRALIYPRTADGPILRLEDFSVTRGPDLYVYLSQNADVKTAGDLGVYHDLGLLKSSKGNQNYKLPSNHAGFKSVVIWCKAFGVLFSSATLQP